MDLVHERGSMDLVHESGAWTWSKVGVHGPLVHVLSSPVHECNTVPYARFALKKRHGFCAKAREKNMPRHRLGTL